MPRSPFIVIVACIALVSAACTRSEPATSRQTASGEVAPARGATGLSGLTDSVSARADKGRIRGAESAHIWLVEISDFQCPYCKRWHDDTYAGIDSEFVKTGKVRLAYLNYPISSLHPNARVASEAAMCASVQGKFWALHESLFITQQAWASEKDPMPKMDLLATAAGVDAKRWRASVGEGLQAKPVLDLMRERHPSLQLAYTWFSPSAREFAAGLPVDFQDALPFDSTPSMRRALAALSPRALVFSKLDVWPTLAREAATRGTRLGLISATLARNSTRRKGLAAALLRDAYGWLDRVGAVSAEDADRLGLLRVPASRVTLTRDTRFDQVWARPPPPGREGPLRAPMASQA